MTRCKSCGAPIRWIYMVTGRRMPLDPDPVPNGNITIGDDGKGRVGPITDGAFRSHFSSCPQAAQHRRPK